VTAALFNGQPDATALAWHRGLHYGDGVFRTSLVYAGRCVDLDLQVDKLRRDAQALGLRPPPAAALATEAAALAAGTPRAALKMLLLRAGAERGYRSEADACDRLLCRYPAPEFPAARWERGIRAFRSDFRLAAQPALAGIKHLNRLEQVLASRAWQEGADEGIVADAEGRPVSGTRSNLFWVAAGVLRTPALETCGVAGLMRDKVLAAAAALGQPVTVGPASWEELESAEEAFVTNSMVGLWPLSSLDSRAWHAPGPVTRRLSEHLRHPRLVRA
jgi:4-amino-4-deoxychorismate lyase